MQHAAAGRCPAGPLETWRKVVAFVALYGPAQIIYSAEDFRVRVRDDGQGIDTTANEAGDRPGHWGLKGMRERAQKIGAHLEIWSRPNAGTEIELTIPAAAAYGKRVPRLPWMAAWRLARR
jgi:two-component sensor histidine kinase